MERYERYKPSGVKWIGKIPEHWDSKRLKYVASVQPSNVDKKTVEDELPVLLCNYMDVYKNEFIDSSINFMEATATEAEIAKFKIKKGDVLVTKDSETPDDIANPAFAKDDFENVICAYHLTQIRPNRSELIGEYLFRLFQGTKYKGQFEVAANGVTRFGLGVSAFSDALVPLPRLEEQTAIASFLDEKTTQIDTLIKKKQKLIEFLKEQRMAIINHAVTKGIDTNGTLKPSGIEWLGDIPEHWEVKKLSYGFKKIGSGTTPASGNEEYYNNGIINWLQTGDLNDGEINSTSKKITEQALKDYSTLREYPIGSLVIAMYGATIGKVGLLNIATTTNQACCVIAEPISFDTKYVFYWFVGNKEYVVSKSYGGGQPNISQELIKSLRLPCPPKTEQSKIVQRIETETQKIDATISKIEKEIELLQEYRTALISEVVTGKIKVM